MSKTEETKPVEEGTDSESDHHELPLYQTFFALFVLTIIEVAVGYAESTPFVVSLLVGIALVKAALVGAVFMEIAFSKEATKIVLSVFAIPFIGVLILILTIWSDWRQLLGA